MSMMTYVDETFFSKIYREIDRLVVEVNTRALTAPKQGMPEEFFTLSTKIDKLKTLARQLRSPYNDWDYKTPLQKESE